MADHEIFEAGPLVLQSGFTIPETTIAYQTHGELNSARSNAILMPTFFGGHHVDTELMLTPGRALDPAKHFIIVPNMIGNGLSSSPSTTPPPFDGPSFPAVSLYDQVVLQHRLVTEHLGIHHLRLVVGFSMGAQQAFQWGALYPETIDAIAPICGSAKTSAHNSLLLEGAKTALICSADFDDGWYRTPPARGLLAFSRAYGSLVACPAFYREREYAKLGLSSPEDTMRFFEGRFRQRDANDLLAMLSTWQHADISANDVFESDMAAALGVTKARAIVMPSETDLLFAASESEIEVGLMPNAELRPIPSNWGHIAGLGANPADNRVIDEALKELLA